MFKVTSRTSGGIGNVLFQIAAGYAYAKRHGYEYILYEDLNMESNHKSIFEYGNLLSNIKKEGSRPSGIWADHQELSFPFKSIPEYNCNLMLNGYFQSEKYFADCDMRDVFNIPKFAGLSEYTSIHVRRGDYLDSEGYHPVLDMDYYNAAMSICGGKYIVVSEDIEWCMDNFKGDDFCFCHNDPLYDLATIASCKNHIVANSTFSWWGAYLNSNKDKTVVMPKTWLNPSIDTKDIYPEGAIIV
jgi:hypothetical protein